jgi:alpha-mannosidase
MPQLLVNGWHQALGWVDAHPTRAVCLVAILLLGLFTLATRVMTRLVTRRVVRQVFGDIPITSVQPWAATIRLAHEQAGQAITESQEHAQQAIEEMNEQVRERLLELIEMARNNEIPFQIVVDNPEDRQALEAAIARIQPRVVYRKPPEYGHKRGHKRRTKAEKEREESVPTAWTRVLGDECGSVIDRDLNASLNLKMLAGSSPVSEEAYG